MRYTVLPLVFMFLTLSVNSVVAAEDYPGVCIPEFTIYDITRELQTSPVSLTNPFGIGFMLSDISGWPELGPFGEFFKATAPVGPINLGNHLAFWLADIAKI